MLDIKFIRENPDKVKKGCQAKQVKVDIDDLLETDKMLRETLQALEDMRAQKNKATREISKIKDDKERKKIILKMRELDGNSDRLTKRLKELEERFNHLMLQIPNLPGEEVPIGKDGSQNKFLREVGNKPKFKFKFKDYLTLAEDLDLIDIKRAAKISGSRFSFLKNEAALLEFAMINLAFDTLRKDNFQQVIPPVMLKPEMARGTGYFEATDINEAYFIQKDNLFLVGTSEQSLLAMHAGEILEEKELSKKYLSFSTCFRREAGSYGKDTKGILRVHQFDKIEMFCLSKPEDSEKEYGLFLEREERLMKLLKIPYRVVQMCTGDLGFPAASKYDIESWIPSENCYRETHSVSNCTDFQARRLNIRYRDKSGKLDFVHTINGTVFAVGRMLISIIENYQQKDGSIMVPEVLQKYTGFKKISGDRIY